MGGGDLNSKKSWHPNTMKNQERVWKAEQMAAEEKKRILELQQERAQERDRQELNELARKSAQATNNTSDNRLDWMYNKPDKQHQQEDYLLGKAIDKNFEQSGKADQNEIPAVARRVVGSSMLSSTSDVQVDLARKMREDPLLLVKERERAARAALLNNPVQRKRLAELLRKEQEQKQAQKEKKKHKKKDKDLDNLLAEKLNALSSNKVNLAKLLESDDSSDTDSSDEDIIKKKKKKNKKQKKKEKKAKDRSKNKDNRDKHEKSSNSSKHKKTKYNSEDNDSQADAPRYNLKRKSSISENEAGSKRKKHKHDKQAKSKKDYCSSFSSDEAGSDRLNKFKQNNREINHRKETKDSNKDRSRNNYKDNRDQYSTATNYDRRKEHNDRPSRDDNRQGSKRMGLSEEEKAAKLAEMAAAGAEREVQRERRVAAQIAENSAAEKYQTSRIPARNEARALPDSLASRIHSNRHYIQRNKQHMNENFARR